MTAPLRQSPPAVPGKEREPLLDSHFISEKRAGLCSSPFPMSLEDIGTHFCFSAKRRQLFKGLSDYVDAVRSLKAPPILQLISGSFLDRCDSPRDVDVANIVESVEEAGMPLYFDKRFTLERFGVDPLTIVRGGDAQRDALAMLRLSTYYGCRRLDGGQRGFIWLV